MKTKITSNIALFVIILAMIFSCSRDDLGKTTLNNQTNQPKVTAAFSYSILNQGVLPTNVNFTSSSENSTAYKWTFGDGKFSTEQNPSHSYDKEGDYMVKLLASGSSGKDSISKTVTITQNLPIANFDIAMSNSGQVPCQVSFTNLSKNAASYKWTFSDGEISTIENPTKMYNLHRTFSVKLVASNQKGSNSLEKTFTIKPISKSVVVYLITPKDKAFNQDYYNVLKNECVSLQSWYKNQLGNNKTFVLNPMVLDTLKGNHNRDWYNSNNGAFSGTDPRFYGYYNAYYEMQQLLGNKFNTSEYTYFVYVAAPGGGAGSTGFCAMGDQDLDGLLGKNPENFNPNRWIGGGGHELGHSFGLPHPANQNPQAIMWTGYANYPNCILQAEDKTILNNSTFFR